MSEPDRIRESAERDQLWASLRALHPHIDRLAAGGPDGSDFDRQLVSILARVVAAELAFRAAEPELGSAAPPADPPGSP